MRLPRARVVGGYGGPRGGMGPTRKFKNSYKKYIIKNLRKGGPSSNKHS